MNKELQKTLTVGSFLPAYVVNSLKKGGKVKGNTTFTGTLFYADISGFTKLSEDLAKIGREGAETLTGIINEYFETLIYLFADNGGDIYRFGGDAIFGFFPDGKQAGSSVKHALKASMEAISFIKGKNKIKIGKSTFPIRMHIGLTHGNIYFQDLGSDYFLGGKASYDLMKMVDLAKAGEIAVNSAIKKFAKELKFTSPQRGTWLLSPPFVKAKTLVPAKTKVTETGDYAVIRGKMEGYIPVWLKRRIDLNPFFAPKDGEHRNIAVLFIHFKGFDFDNTPKESSKLLKDFYKTLDNLSNKYDGFLNKIDIYERSVRILLVIGFPNAHEDINKRAVQLAYELKNSKASEKLEVSIGINGGFAFATPVGTDHRREYTVMGDTVNLTARLASGASHGMIEVSKAIFDSTSSLFKYKALGEKKFKGKTKGIPIFRLQDKAETSAANVSKWLSESSKIVGRGKELAKAYRNLKSASSTKGRILGITGEAGMGKSRFTKEVVKRLNKLNFSIKEGACLSYGANLSYYPWISVMNSLLKIEANETKAAKKKKLQTALRALGTEYVKLLPIVGEAMGIDFPENEISKHIGPKIRKQRFFDIVLRLVKDQAKIAPLTIIIDDIHWIDSVSMELIEHVSANIDADRVLLLLVFRPLQGDFEFRKRSNYAEIPVAELDNKGVEELVGNLLNVDKLPGDFKKLIIKRSQGNPFYAEEIVKSLVEQGFIKEKLPGKWEFTGDANKIDIPDTIEGVILTRIDRLDLLERDVIQTASVLGREFDEEILTGLYSADMDLSKILDNLGKLDIILKGEQSESNKYIFKHIFTQEVSYGTISFAKRRELHSKVGIYIEDKFSKRRDEYLGIMSYHFHSAKDYDRSLLYSVLAGEKAKAVYANEEAVQFFTRAIESYEEMTDQQ
ncbi:AAA family ATPase [bacterium]|nr:AAA family ATPase [bacterium]